LLINNNLDAYLILYRTRLGGKRRKTKQGSILGVIRITLRNMSSLAGDKLHVRVSSMAWLGEEIPIFRFYNIALSSSYTITISILTLMLLLTIIPQI